MAFMGIKGGLGVVLLVVLHFPRLSSLPSEWPWKSSVSATDMACTVGWAFGMDLVAKRSQVVRFACIGYLVDSLGYLIGLSIILNTKSTGSFTHCIAKS